MRRGGQGAAKKVSRPLRRLQALAGGPMGGPGRLRLIASWRLWLTMGGSGKGPPFVIGVADTIRLRVNGQIQYIDEVHWHSSEKRVATVEWVDFTQAEVVGKRAGVTTISVNVSGQRDGVTVTP